MLPNFKNNKDAHYEQRMADDESHKGDFEE